MQQTIQTNQTYKKQHLQKNQKTPNAAQHHQQRPLHIKNKITATTGATIVFALAVFIIAAIMSMVIVNAALNNVQRVSRQRDEQQALLAISSAASYVNTLFKGCRATYDGSTWSFEFDGSGIGKPEMTSFQEDFKKLVKEKKTLTWKLNASSTSDTAMKDALDVEMELSMDSSYTLIMKIEKTDAAANGGESDPSYAGSKQLEFPASVRTVGYTKADGTTGSKTVVDW